MNTSGNNRYELLFMDEDGGAAVRADNVSKQNQLKGGSASANVAAKKKVAAVKKPKVKIEKENEPALTIDHKVLSDKKISSGVRSAPPALKSKQSTTDPVANGQGRPNGVIDIDDSHSPNIDYSHGQRNDNRELQSHSQPQSQPQQQQQQQQEQRFGRRNYRENDYVNAGSDFKNEQRPYRQFKDRENRGPGRNRYAEGSYRVGKREFDRQSGSDKTGVKAVDKRDGAGARNWGSLKQDIDDMDKANTDGEATLTDKEELANDQGPDQAPAVEEETKELTLDEWKAMREQRSKPVFNIRKAGEGEDISQWKKMIVLNKKKDEENDSEEELEYDPSMYPQRVGRLQRIVDIQFNFNDGRRGNGAGGFGRGRGGMRRFDSGRGRIPNDMSRTNLGRSRNYTEKPRGVQNALKVDDERQFPTLS